MNFDDIILWHALLLVALWALWAALWMLQSARLGLIRKVGYRLVSNPKAHSTPAAIWLAIEKKW